MAVSPSVLQTPPQIGSGIQIDPESDWRITVELLLQSAEAARWGSARWGRHRWSTQRWQDVTGWLRGFGWSRGAEEFAGRPRVGVAEFTFDNTGYRWSPIDPANSFQGAVIFDADDRLVNRHFGPGAVIRVTCHNPVLAAAEPRWDQVNWDDFNWGGVDWWVPQFTGVVESWPESRHELNVESFVHVTAVESLSLLAKVDTNALANVVGNDDTAEERVRRLADAAGWQWGYRFDGFGAFDTDDSEFLLQSTDMANNRLAEIYRTADSVGGVVRSDRSGLLLGYGGLHQLDEETGELLRDPPEVGPLPHPIFDAATYTGAGDAGHVQVDPEGITWDNDDLPVVNYAQIGRSGSTVQTASDQTSIDRMNGPYTFQRSDLINKSDTLCQLLAQTLVDERAFLISRLRDIRVDTLADPRAVEALISVDVHTTVGVRQQLAGGARLAVEGRVDAMEHQVTPLPEGGARWTCRYALGVQTAPTRAAAG